MKRVFVLLLAIAFTLAAHGGPAPSLIGSWKSNRELSVATVKLANPLPPEKRARFDNLFFGNAVITFSPTEYSVFTPALEKYPAKTVTTGYRIVAASDRQMVIRTRDEKTQKDEDDALHFEGPNRFWMEITGVAGVTGHDYYDRVVADPLKPAPAK